MAAKTKKKKAERPTKANGEIPEPLRSDLRGIYERARRVRRDLMTDAMEMDWENDEQDVGELFTILRTLHGIVEIEFLMLNFVENAR